LAPTPPPPATPDRRLEERLTDLTLVKDTPLRLAAARVVGALSLQGPAVERGVAAMVASEDADECALAAQVAGQCKLTSLAGTLVSKVALPEPVGPAARDALRQMGEAAVAALKAALPHAEGQARSQVQSLLVSLGGVKTFQQLLQDLFAQDLEQARTTAQAMKRTVKGMTPGQRLKLLEQLRLFLATPKVREHPIVRPVAVRMVGFLQLPEATQDLVPLVAPFEERTVRLEALGGLRSSLPAQSTAAVVLAHVLPAVLDPSAEVSAAALATAMNLAPDASHAPLLTRILTSNGKEASRWAAGALVKVGGEAVCATLSSALKDALTTNNQDLVHVVARTLRDVPGGPGALVQAFTQATPHRRHEVERALVEPSVAVVETRALDTLGQAAILAVSEGREGAEGLCTLWRRLDPGHHATTLRAALSSETDGRRRAALAAEVSRNPSATPEDKLALALQQLRLSVKEVRAAAKDPTLATLAKLSAQGLDVAGAMQADPHMEPADWLYVGFKLCESSESRVQSQGVDLLTAVKDKVGPEHEAGRAAVNKLKLLGEL
jgi:hypothetical protein